MPDFCKGRWSNEGKKKKVSHASLDGWKNARLWYELGNQFKDGRGD